MLVHRRTILCEKLFTITAFILTNNLLLMLYSENTSRTSLNILSHRTGIGRILKKSPRKYFSSSSEHVDYFEFLNPFLFPHDILVIRRIIHCYAKKILCHEYITVDVEMIVKTHLHQSNGINTLGITSHLSFHSYTQTDKYHTADTWMSLLVTNITI